MTSRFPGLITFLSVAALCMFLNGCVKDNSELEKKILADDPTFQKTLNFRNSLRNELNVQKSGFLKKKQEIGIEINNLKEQVRVAKSMYSSSVERIKRQLYPRKRELETELMEMKRRFKLKNEMMKDVERDVNEISSLIEKKEDLALTQEEIKTWNDRLSLLLDKKETLGSDKNKLETDIKVTRMKIKVLEL